MTDNPREIVSEITEMNDSSQIYAADHFCAASGWGGLAGTASLLSAVVLTSGTAQDGFAELVWGAMLFGFFVTLFTFAGMIVIGLPVTILLRTLRCENRILYAALGAVSGFLSLAIAFELQDITSLEDLILPGSGAVAGLAAAWRWGGWRQRIALAAATQPEPHKPAKPTNPIHDLLH